MASARDLLVGGPMKRALASMFVVVVLVACGKSESDATSNGDGGGSADGVLDSKPADANGCCPRDTTQSGCMYLGGHTESDSCPRTCDFFCSTNWRVETDEHGCEGWRYDIRSPKPDEGPGCTKRPPGFDAGIDASSDADDAASDAAAE